MKKIFLLSIIGKTKSAILKNEKYIFEIFQPNSRTLFYGCLIAIQTPFNRLKIIAFQAKIIPQILCGLRDYL